MYGKVRVKLKKKIVSRLGYKRERLTTGRVARCRCTSTVTSW